VVVAWAAAVMGLVMVGVGAAWVWWVRGGMAAGAMAVAAAAASAAGVAVVAATGAPVQKEKKRGYE